MSQPWQSKGEGLNPYETEAMSPSDGDLADKAFQRLGEKMEPGQEPAFAYSGKTSTPQALSDDEMADAAFKSAARANVRTSV
jgi:hypothetical protein